MKKLLRRLHLLATSLPNIVLGILFETSKHPWKIVFDTLFLSSSKTQSKSPLYIKKYFKCEKIDSGTLVSISDFRILIPNKFKKDSHYMHAMLVLYFDITYSKSVKYPIPLLVTEGSYEVGGVKPSPGDTIIDVGSNIGFYSLDTISKISPEGKIFAFEPIPFMCNIIRKSLDFNVGHNVEIVEKALGKDDVEIQLNFSEHNFGGASSIIKGEACRISQIKLDTFVKNNNLPKVDLIKMDIEGMEPDALLGASETILKYKPKLAICTYHYPEHPEMIEKIILSIRSDYSIIHTNWKIFAW